MPPPIISYATPNVYLIKTSINELRPIITGGTAINYTIDKLLPAGLNFDSSTGIVSGTPTVSSAATEYGITAYNKGGSGTTTVNIEVLDPAIIFSTLGNKLPCDIDFDPGATSATGGINYTSSNAQVATITDNKVHIIGAGVTTITASNGYNSSSQLLTVTGLTSQWSHLIHPTVSAV